MAPTHSKRLGDGGLRPQEACSRLISNLVVFTHDLDCGFVLCERAGFCGLHHLQNGLRAGLGAKEIDGSEVQQQRMTLLEESNPLFRSNQVAKLIESLPHAVELPNDGKLGPAAGFPSRDGAPRNTEQMTEPLLRQWSFGVRRKPHSQLTNVFRGKSPRGAVGLGETCRLLRDLVIVFISKPTSRMKSSQIPEYPKIAKSNSSQGRRP